MSEESRDKRRRALKAANEMRTRQAEARVFAALDEMQRSGERINVHGVARRAGVSRSFIYNSPALHAEVHRLADNEPRLISRGSAQRSSDDSLRARLADALERIVSLTDEVAQLVAERENLLGEIRELRRGDRR